MSTGHTTHVILGVFARQEFEILFAYWASSYDIEKLKTGVHFFLNESPL